MQRWDEGRSSQSVTTTGSQRIVVQSDEMLVVAMSGQMDGINLVKVIVGGLVAGLVINIGQTIVHVFLFARQSAALTEALNLREPTGGQIGMFWVLGFVIGLMNSPSGARRRAP